MIKYTSKCMSILTENYIIQAIWSLSYMTFVLFIIYYFTLTVIIYSIGYSLIQFAYIKIKTYKVIFGFQE